MNVDEQMVHEAIERPDSVVEATEATEALKFDYDLDQLNDLDQLKRICNYQQQAITRLSMELINVKETLLDTQSQLDKFKSVYNSSKLNEFYSVPLSPKLQKKPRNTRLMGISAEPQTSVSFQDLINTKFPEYPKEERWVHHVFAHTMLFA